MGRRYLAQFASSLDEAIQNTAEDAGKLDDYVNDEYRKAMKLTDAWEAVKGMVTRTIQNVPWVGATYAIANRR